MKFRLLSWYAWITLACVSYIRRAVIMRDLFSLFDMFNSYTIFSIVLHLVFFVVIASVIPKLKNKRLTLLMKTSAWYSKRYSMLHYVLSIYMLGIKKFAV